MKDLSVLHVGKFYPPHPGGMETHLQSLCEELRKHIDVEALVSSDERRTAAELINDVKVTRAGTLFNLAAAPVCPDLSRLVRQSSAPIVHIHFPHPTAILAYLASGHKGRLIFTYHSDIVRQKMLSRAFAPVLKHALNRADAIIVSSPNYIESSPVLREFRGKCRVIPFGVLLERFEKIDAARVARTRELYGPRLVLGVGRLVYYKGFEYLIRAMAWVEGRLVIVGKGPLFNSLWREAKAAGVSKRIEILTDVEDVSPFYHAADVFALSSIARSEAFGIVQLEAMACGKPVVNTLLDSGVPFVSPHGVSGLTVPPRDSESLGRAINALLDDPVQRDLYGRAALMRVKEKFSIEQMTRQTLELYRDVLNSPN